MQRHQARNLLSRFGAYAFPSVLTVLGLALVGAGLRDPSQRPWAVVSRQRAVAPSARGALLAGRQWLAFEQEALASEPSSISARWERPPDGFRSMSGLVLEFATPAPTPTPPRTEVITYSVQPGDNVWLIGQRFGITVDTVVWANDRLEMDPDLLSIGELLYIMPVDGVWHTVKAGETLASIAKRYKIEPQAIVDYAPNGLHEPVTLEAGRKLIVPGGEKPFEPRLVHTQAGAVTVNAKPEPGRFIWPCSGAITQYYHKWHLAIDIGNSDGTPIYAGDAGKVTLASWWGGLGNAVSIDHGNGYVTTYGHMRALLVSEGDYVKRGQQIGEMGSTGKSTGPHVHFMVYYYGGAVNPVRYLPPP